jgi:hypothetical protein
MNKGSNANIKQAVARGENCYICEVAKSELIDDVQGHVCRQCHQDEQAIRLRHALSKGYSRKVL